MLTVHEIFGLVLLHKEDQDMQSTWFSNKALNSVAKANLCMFTVAYAGSKIPIKRPELFPITWREKLKCEVRICLGLEISTNWIAFHQCQYLAIGISYMSLHRSMFSFPLYCPFCTEFGKVGLNVPPLTRNKILTICACREAQEVYIYHVNYNVR